MKHRIRGNDENQPVQSLLGILVCLECGLIIWSNHIYADIDVTDNGVIEQNSEIVHIELHCKPTTLNF